MWYCKYQDHTNLSVGSTRSRNLAAMRSGSRRSNMWMTFNQKESYQRIWRLTPEKVWQSFSSISPFACKQKKSPWNTMGIELNLTLSGRCIKQYQVRRRVAPCCNSRFQWGRCWCTVSFVWRVHARVFNNWERFITCSPSRVGFWNFVWDYPSGGDLRHLSVRLHGLEKERAAIIVCGSLSSLIDLAQAFAWFCCVPRPNTLEGMRPLTFKFDITTKRNQLHASLS